uniref:hypothetical protein n=1 Tax=Actinomadura sp. CA-154981 TaxID=3240037 RepID=UPI003F4971AC
MADKGKKNAAVDLKLREDKLNFLRTMFEKSSDRSLYLLGMRDKTLFGTVAIVLGGAYAITTGADSLVLLGLVALLICAGLVYLGADRRWIQAKRDMELVKKSISDLGVDLSEFMVAAPPDRGWQIEFVIVYLTVFCGAPMAAMMFIVAQCTTAPAWVFPVGGIEVVGIFYVAWRFLSANPRRPARTK